MNATGKLFLDYRYNSRGLIGQIATSQKGAATVNRNITYDNLSRINTFVSNTGTLDFNFDKYGNLTSKAGPLTGTWTYEDKDAYRPDLS